MEDNNLKKPTFILRLSRGHFQSEISCSGKQLVQILTCIQHETSNLTWFAFDVFGSGNQVSEVLFPNPYSEILSTYELIKKAEEIIQFHSGVFIGIKKGKKIGWDSNTLPETEEGEGLQHPEAEIEIRPFDTSYFEVYGMDIDIGNKIKSCFM
ncbi:hypothetical protein [Paenibacillus lutrae]|uniref:hypothetical protein n=1 Tax=Paenibacillus lutrae TaxID=2078573 RepID=UPI0014121408|nr:hypothetical protein [Paenibacillus lutrae]